MFRRKSKELQKLVDSSRKALKEAESKIQNKNRLIADMEEQAEVLYKEKKELQEVINRIDKLVNFNKYNNEKAVLNKIKELVRDYQSIN